MEVWRDKDFFEDIFSEIVPEKANHSAEQQPQGTAKSSAVRVKDLQKQPNCTQVLQRLNVQTSG